MSDKIYMNIRINHRFRVSPTHSNEETSSILGDYIWNSVCYPGTDADVELLGSKILYFQTTSLRAGRSYVTVAFAHQVIIRADDGARAGKVAARLVYEGSYGGERTDVNVELVKSRFSAACVTDAK